MTQICVVESFHHGATRKRSSGCWPSTENAPLVLESVSLTDVYREIQHACPNTRTYSMYSLALSLSLPIHIYLNMYVYIYIIWDRAVKSDRIAWDPRTPLRPLRAGFAMWCSHLPSSLLSLTFCYAF